MFFFFIYSRAVNRLQYAPKKYTVRKSLFTFRIAGIKLHNVASTFVFLIYCSV